MPQFSDLSDAQIADLVRWIHYARRQGRYKELTAEKAAVPGNAAAGKDYFQKTCASCHSPQGDFAKIGDKYDSAGLKTHLLRPEFLNQPQSWKLDQLHDVKAAAARQRHFSLLENYSQQQVANLLAYLQTLKQVRGTIRADMIQL
jgi:mono/diheme cytochrome c family protein